LSAHKVQVKESTIHLICGSTGAGKSTYASRLSQDTQAVHLSIDDWMFSLFGAELNLEQKDSLDWNWISERATRCENKILSLAIALAQIGTSSILEIGFQRVSRRHEIASLLREAHCAFQTHYLDVNATERWRRVQRRNMDKGETYRFELNKGMFDFFEGMWESPDEKELLSLNQTTLLRH